MTHSLLTLDRLREVLTYDPSTGVFVWKFSLNHRWPAGRKAGAISGRGHIAICVDKARILAHRLAWFYVHGELPASEIDHINGDKADNRIANLRCATTSQNGCNRGKQSNNKSGYKGVSWHSKRRRWQASIKANGRRIHLGYYRSLEEARQVYVAAAIRNHGEFARSA